MSNPMEMMAESLSRLEESLGCPVCYKIPRDVPIPCCESGHIVCQDCRKRVTNCPTCRGRLGSNTSSLAASQIMFVNHKCKFFFYSCDVKMKLEDIVHHEKSCLERTIKCPNSLCNQEIQLKKFQEHSTENGCAENPAVFGHIFNSASLKMNFYMDKNDNEDEGYQFIPIRVEDLLFYFELFFSVSKQSFIFRVFLLERVETASKYSTRITVSPNSPRKLIYEGPVLSIEDLPDMDSSQAYEKYWIVAKEAMIPHNLRDDERICLGIKFTVSKQG